MGNRRKMHRQSGFSLVEIMVVVVIIGMLAAIVGKQVIDNLEDAKVQAAKTQIRQFGEALQLYKIKKGKYPSNGEGLEELTKPDKKDRTFMDAIPKDPWGNDYEYKKTGNKFDITSFGSDGEEDGEGYAADIKYSELGKGEDE